MQAVKRTCRTDRGLSRTVIILSGLVCSVSLCAGYLAVRTLTARWVSSIANVERLMRKGRYDEALAMARELHSGGTEAQSRAFTCRGKIWLAQAREREEESGWKRYGLDRRDWMPTPEAEKARRSLAHAVALDPRNMDARYYLGILFMEKGWFVQAENQFSEILARRAEYTDALISRASVYVYLGRYREAERDLRRAFGADETDPAVAKNLGVLYRYYLHEPESAMVWSNRYLNYTSTADRDRYFIKQDLNELMQRYPEFPLPEKPDWRVRRRFGARRTESR